MGNYEQLIAAIQQVIKTNGNNEITGAILQNTLKSIVNSIGANATFAGVATPNTNPGTPDQNEFWLAVRPGVYSNFGGLTVDATDLALFVNKDGSWAKTALNLSLTLFFPPVGAPIDLSSVPSHPGAYYKKDGAQNQNEAFIAYDVPNDILVPGQTYIQSSGIYGSMGILFEDADGNIIYAVDGTDIGRLNIVGSDMFIFTVPKGTVTTKLSFYLGYNHFQYLAPYLFVQPEPEPEPEPEIALLPPYIYLAQDSYEITDTVPATLYAERLFASENDVIFKDSQSPEMVVSPSMREMLSANKSEMKISLAMSHNLIYDTTLRLAKTSNGINTPVRLLCIGDSVTAGTGGNFNKPDIPRVPAYQYWSLLQGFFLDDARKSSNDNNFPVQCIGFYNSRNATSIIGDSSLSKTAFAEGRGGWSFGSYLLEQEKDGTKNPFYDESKVWTDSELNSEGVKFSLNKYLERFRNYSDDGVKLEQGSAGIGTNITFSGSSNKRQLVVRDTDAYVATPTHILICLGFNDTLENNIKNAPLMIKAIREEFPTIPIGLGFLNAAGTWRVPKTYNYQDVYWGYGDNNYLNSKMFSFFNTYKNLVSESDNIYFIPLSFVQPTAESWATVEIETYSGKIYNNSANQSSYHPNFRAHEAWARQIYNWLKFMLG